MLEIECESFKRHRIPNSEKQERIMKRYETKRIKIEKLLTAASKYDFIGALGILEPVILVPKGKTQKVKRKSNRVSTRLRSRLKEMERKRNERLKEMTYSSVHPRTTNSF